MVGFNDIPFVVLTTSGRLPHPKKDEATGFDWYEAEIHLTSRAQMIELRNLQTQITARPAAGLMGAGTVVAERGPGKKVLIYPDGGSEITVDAILTTMTIQSFVGHQNSYRCTAKWFLVDAVS